MKAIVITFVGLMIVVPIAQHAFCQAVQGNETVPDRQGERPRSALGTRELLELSPPLHLREPRDVSGATVQQGQPNIYSQIDTWAVRKGIIVTESARDELARELVQYVDVNGLRAGFTTSQVQNCGNR
jgi:hypothetical protein